MDRPPADRRDVGLMRDDIFRLLRELLLQEMPNIDLGKLPLTSEQENVFKRKSTLLKAELRQKISEISEQDMDESSFISEVVRQMGEIIKSHAKDISLSADGTQDLNLYKIAMNRLSRLVADEFQYYLASKKK